MSLGIPSPSDWSRPSYVWLKFVMRAASKKGTLNIENECTTSKLFALKFPVLIAFAIDAVISTWHPMVESITFNTIATPNALLCIRTCR